VIKQMEIQIDFEFRAGIVQTERADFGYNGESSLDLEYAMALVTPLQNVTLYQVGDIVEGRCFLLTHWS
jgi:hypothetical protein